MNTPTNAHSPEAAPIIACDLNAFDPAQAARYKELMAMLRYAQPDVTETEGGLVFTFADADAALCLAAMEFATLERRCCPFLTFLLELAPAGGPLTLTLSGPEGTKEILAGFLTAA